MFYAYFESKHPFILRALKIYDKIYNQDCAECTGQQLLKDLYNSMLSNDIYLGSVDLYLP